MRCKMDVGFYFSFILISTLTWKSFFKFLETYIENNNIAITLEQKYNVVSVRGGLGNQFFQYAFAYILMQETSKPVFLDIDFYGFCPNPPCDNLTADLEFRGITGRKYSLCYFDISLQIANQYQISESKQKIVLEEDILGRSLKEFSSQSPQYFDGFYENLSYNYEKYRDELIKEFTIKKELSIPPIHRKYLKKIESTNSVSIHIRRTDHDYHGYVPFEFYENAIKYMNEHVENPHYFVFSDDLGYVMHNLKINGSHTYIEDTSLAQPIFDFEIMKRCKHNIIANSTFSWWAAFLNLFKNKIVIAPKIWILGRNSDYIVPKNYVVL